MNVLGIFKQVKAFVFDMDGVLTDGTFLIFPDGLHARRMNVKDGYALQLAVKKGYRIIILSGSTSPEAANRLQLLGITDIFMNVKDKRIFLENYFDAHNLNGNEILYMGDDIPDINAMSICLLPCCPSDAVEEVIEVSKYISPFKGGHGCVRDVLKKVLKLNNAWDGEMLISST